MPILKERIIYDCYTGDNLKEYIKSTGVSKLEERDFVKGIGEYLRSKHLRVYSISGLRGVGKTTGILQTIANLDEYENSLYIIIDEMSSMDCVDLREILEKYDDKKYIFIDEVTRINGFIGGSGFLADKIVAEGKRVVISGTDSLSLVKTSGSGLYHRCIIKNVTHISYREVKKTMGLSLAQYVDFGGLYTEDFIKDVAGVRQYIETAVIDNIMNTLNKNEQVTSLLGLEGIDRLSLRTMVFRILYAVIYSSIKPSRTTNVLKFINQYEFADSEYYDAKVLNELVCAEMDVDESICISQKYIKSILNAMVDIGILICVPNLNEQEEYSYYITNPSVVTQITRSILKVLDTSGVERKQGWNINSTRGLVFECVLMVHTYFIAEKFGCKTFYYHNKKYNSEVDIIIAKQYDDEFESKFLLYEVKYTNDADIAILKTKWLNDISLNEDISNYGTVIGRSIIYSGESQRFEEFSSKDIFPPNGTTLGEIRDKTFKTMLINAEEYLLSIKDIVMKL